MGNLKSVMLAAFAVTAGPAGKAQSSRPQSAPAHANDGASAQDSRPASAPAGPQTWTDPATKITITFPAGFTVPSETDKFARGDMMSTGAGLAVNFLSKPDPNAAKEPGPLNAASLLVMNRDDLIKRGYEILRCEIRTLDGCEIVYLQSRIKAPKGNTVRSVTILAGIGGQMNTVNFAISEGRWKIDEKLVDAMIHSIKFGGKAARKTEFAGTQVDGSNWILPKQELRVPIPRGWTVGIYNEKPALFGIRTGLSDNVNVVDFVNLGKKDAAALLKENEETLDDAIIKSEVRTIAGDKAAYFQWRRKTGSFDCRFVSIIFPRGDRQIVVTITILESRWKEVESAVEEIVNGLEFIKK